MWTNAVFVNWTLKNKIQWNFNQNTKLFIHENAYVYIVWEMAAIFCPGRVNEAVTRTHHPWNQSAKESFGATWWGNGWEACYDLTVLSLHLDKHLWQQFNNINPPKFVHKFRMRYTCATAVTSAYIVWIEMHYDPYIMICSIVLGVFICNY